MQYQNLGKGLAALLKEREEINNNLEKKELVKFIDIDLIEPGQYQPRKKFEYDKIKELSDSISNNGLLQPLLVYKDENGKFKLIAGERRWRACKLAGVNEVPVIIKILDNKELLKIALIENIQREELSCIEEAEAFERLVKDFGYTIEEIAINIGKSKSHIINIIRLNQLPASIKDYVNNNELTMGHARCLIGHEQAEEIAQHIIKNHLNVRQTENTVKIWHKKNINHEEKAQEISENNKKVKYKAYEEVQNDIQQIASFLSEKLGTKVTIKNDLSGGKLIISYQDLEQLDDILARIK